MSRKRLDASNFSLAYEMEITIKNIPLTPAVSLN